MRINDITGVGWVHYYGPLTDGFDSPWAVVVAGGQIYVTDSFKHRIARFSGMTGSGWTTYGTGPGSGVGQFNQPAGIALDMSGAIYVSDLANHRIARVNGMTGAGWTTLGGPSPGNGVKQFSAPGGIFVREY